MSAHTQKKTEDDECKIDKDAGGKSKDKRKRTWGKQGDMQLKLKVHEYMKWKK